MRNAACWARLITAVGLMSMCAAAAAQSAQAHGRVIAVNLVNADSASTRAAATIATKDTVLLAEADEAFDRAERRVRLLCRD